MTIYRGAARRGIVLLGILVLPLSTEAAEITGQIRHLQLVHDQAVDIDLLFVWGESGIAFCISDLSQIHILPLPAGAKPSYAFTPGNSTVVLTIDPLEFTRLKTVTVPSAPCD